MKEIPKILKDTFVTQDTPNDRWFDSDSNLSSYPHSMLREQYQLAVKAFSEYDPLGPADISNLRLITKAVI